jgi:FkbM family methyltransferase
MQEIMYKNVDWSQADLSNWYADDKKNNFLYSHPLDENSLVIDIGSYDGTWLKKITNQYDCFGVGLEPVNNFFIKSLNNLNEKLKFLNIGLTTQEDHKSKILSNGDCSNIFNDDGDTEINLVNVTNFFNQMNFKKIDLMQINIEGYEYELLPYMIEKKLFDKIDRIQVQFHAVSNLSELKYKDIKSSLNGIGFTDLFDYKFVWYGGKKI